MNCPLSHNHLPEKDHSVNSVVPLRAAPFLYRKWKILGNPSDFVDHLIHEFGDFVHYRGLIEFYLINDPALVSQFFKQTHRQFDKQTIVYKRFRYALGDSLVNAEGDHWKRQRKLMSPTFTPASVKSFFSMMLNQTQSYMNAWEETIAQGRTLNFSKEMNELALEISGRALFSDSFADRADDITKWVHTISRFSARPPLPIISDPKFPRLLTIKMNRVKREFKEFIAQLIAERSEMPERDDLFSILLNMRDEETGEAMTESEIAEEVLGMIIGSHESTATTLTLVFYELGKSPSVLSTLLSEIEYITQGRDLQYEQISELKYLKQVIDETLRLHPPFWFENRNAAEEIELGGVTIKKGSLVAMSRYALHRNPKYWGNPNNFDPRRFDETKIDMNELLRSGKYVPFSTGPRVCIGRHFAIMELMVVVCTILQKYEVMLSPLQTGEKTTNLTMELKHGLNVTLKHR